MLLQVHDLRKLIAGASHLPMDEMKLIFRGNALLDNKNGDAAMIQLHDGGLSFIYCCYLVNCAFFSFTDDTLGQTCTIVAACTQNLGYKNVLDIPSHSEPKHL